MADVSNWVGNVRFAPTELRELRTISDVTATLADARREKQKVKVVGSLHSSSKVIVTEGIALSLAAFQTKRVFLHEDRVFVHVGGGVTIRELNRYLHLSDHALLNMGGYDGQTLVGAIQTGTHGSGLGLGAFPDMVVGIDLVTGDGRFLRVTPNDAPPIPAPPLVEPALVVDDDMFRACVVGLGLMGIVTSVAIEIRKGYRLCESRLRQPWREVSKFLASETKHPTDALLARGQHGRRAEISLNPYATRNGRTDHTAIVTKRIETDGPPTGKRPKGIRHIPLIKHLDDLTTLLGDRIPRVMGWLIDASLGRLVDLDGYTDHCFEVYNLGRANDIEVYAAEIFVPLEKTVEAVEHIFENARESLREGLYHSGPVSLRFLDSSPHLLAMTNGPRDTAWCSIEIAMMNGTDRSMEMLLRIQERLARIGGRPHWGQVHLLGPAAIDRLFAGTIARFRAERARLDPDRLFDNAFSTRLRL